MGSDEIKRNGITTASFKSFFDALLQEFTEQFHDLSKILLALQLVASPHRVDTENASLDLQIEFVELKNWNNT